MRKVSAGFSMIFSIFGVTSEDDMRREESWESSRLRKSAAEEGRSQVSLCSTTISMSCRFITLDWHGVSTFLIGICGRTST